MSEAQRFLPYGRQSIDERDIAAVVEVLRADYLTTGPRVPQFERAFAQATGAPHALSCANGTAALHLAALALGIGPGDQVIVPAISFVATANAPRLAGAEIVFADVDPVSALMTPGTLAGAIARSDPARLRAVFVVHMGGHPADLPAIAEMVRGRGLKLIEDACHALGSTYERPGGPGRIGDAALSDAATFSLHPVKTITAGEGGVVTTRDASVAQRIARLRAHGIEREPARWIDPAIGRADDGSANPWAYELHEPGFNYRLTDIQAALAESQLARLPEFAARRRALTARYRERLASCGHVRLVPDPGRGESCLHLMVAHVDFARLRQDRATVMRRLAEAGIGTQVHYIPIHRQPAYRGTATPALPGADAYYATCLSLPLYPGMTLDDVDRVADALTAL